MNNLKMSINYSVSFFRNQKMKNRNHTLNGQQLTRITVLYDNLAWDVVIECKSSACPTIEKFTIYSVSFFSVAAKMQKILKLTEISVL